MNSLLLLQYELKDNHVAIISGERARGACARHKLSQGNEIRISVLNGKRGRAQVESISTDEIVLTTSFTLEPLSRSNCFLIVALPRPQTAKKVVHAATTFGVNELHFIRSEKVEKSYFDSSILEPKNLEHEVHLGLEQCCDSISPIINIHSLFNPFVEDLLPQIISKTTSPILQIAHTTRSDSTLPVGMQSRESFARSVVLAVGPEAGWNDHEVHSFQRHRFSIVSLGDRIHRVEVATAALLGQLLPM